MTDDDPTRNIPDDWHRRGIIQIPAPELMAALNLDGEFLGIRNRDPWTATGLIEVLIRHPDLAEVDELAEPPILEDRAKVSRYTPLVLALDETTETVRWDPVAAAGNLDPHTADLVLAATAITPGATYWTCARLDHSIDPRDFVHTTAPCPDTPDRAI